MKALVIFFSAERRTTARVAEEFAASIGGDLYEIQPKVPYSTADLRWTNPLSRCNREFFGKKDVPVEGRVENWTDYDTVYVGFPIWYGCAPNVVNTFCKGYDWAGKTVYVFATSGGSGIGKTAEKLSPYLKGGKLVSAKLVHTAAEI